MQASEIGEERYVCEIEGCGRSYSRSRALRRHMTETHGYPPSPNTAKRRIEPSLEPPDEDSVSFQVRARLRLLAAPLKEEMAEIDRRLVVVNREVSDLREARAQLEKTLRGLEGPQAKATGVGNLSAANFETKQKAVRRFIERHAAELSGGFTVAALNREMKRLGAKPIMSTEVTNRAVQTLHEQGLLRADRIVKGGGMQYLIVGRNGGEPDGEET